MSESVFVSVCKCAGLFVCPSSNSYVVPVLLRLWGVATVLVSIQDHEQVMAYMCGVERSCIAVSVRVVSVTAEGAVHVSA